jgi:hypothetical protein
MAPSAIFSGGGGRETVSFSEDVSLETKDESFSSGNLTVSSTDVREKLRAARDKTWRGSLMSARVVFSVDENSEGKVSLNGQDVSQAAIIGTVKNMASLTIN